MKCRFKQGSEAILKKDDSVVTIALIKRDFPTRSTKYKLADGQLVNEDELRVNESLKTPIKGKSENMETLELLRDRYAKVLKKAPPKSKINNAKWLSDTIADFLKTQNPENSNGNSEGPGAPKEENQLKYNALKDLYESGKLEDFIKDKGLEIFPEDYKEDQLLTAVCEELGVVLP